MTSTPIIALDVSTLAEAIGVVERLGTACDYFKIGSELFTNAGPAAIAAVRGRGKRVFLDLKLHDIPNTVALAAASAARLGVSLITAHAAGGVDMLRAAVAGAGPECGVLAVTVLTSMDAAELGRVWARPTVSVAEEVVRLSRTALDAGAHGVVCAGSELSAVRADVGACLATLVPAIRFDNGERHDQKRVMSPYDAARLDATYMVLGRAVTGAADPLRAMERAREELSRAEREIMENLSAGTDREIEGRRAESTN